jgi:nitroreductase
MSESRHSSLMLSADDVGAAAGDASEIVSRLMAQRYSCRGYLAEAVPRATILRILSMAQRAPSWGNVQPWEVLITSQTGTERFRTALTEHAARGSGEPDLPFPREYRQRYMDRRRAAALKLFDSVGAVTRGQSAKQIGENFRLYGAPHVAIVTTDVDLGVYGAIDCGVYIASFVLAARSVGVSCIAQAAIARYSAFVRAHFGIADDRLVVCGISFGYEDAHHPANGFRTSRLPIEDVVTWVDA